nr:tripartite tricarboxylate transporter TctB family protein [Loktanella sp. SALINAS62]
MVAALFAFLFFEALGYRGRSSYVPSAATGLGVAMCLFWVISVMRLSPEEGNARLPVTRSDLQQFALIVLTGILYLLGFAWIGFFTSTIIVVPFLAAALGYRNWNVLVFTTLGFVILLYGVFRLLLSVPLPREAIFALFGG